MQKLSNRKKERFGNERVVQEEVDDIVHNGRAACVIRLGKVHGTDKGYAMAEPCFSCPTHRQQRQPRGNRLVIG